MPRALTPLLAAALWMRGHQGPEPPPCSGGSTVGEGAGDALAVAAARRRMSARTPASTARRSSRRLRTVASSLAAGPHELLGRALVGDQRSGAVAQFSLGALDAAHDVPVTARDGAHHAELRDQIAEVGGAEHDVQRADVVLLVHGHGARHERIARDPQLPVRQALQPPVLRELPADGLESLRRPRVARDGRVDPGVERGDVGGEFASLGAILLQLACPGARGHRRKDSRRGDRAQRERGDQRQTTYRVAVLQCASSRGRRPRGRSLFPRQPASGPAKG